MGKLGKFFSTILMILPSRIGLYKSIRCNNKLKLQVYFQDTIKCRTDLSDI